MMSTYQRDVDLLKPKLRVTSVPKVVTTPLATFEVKLNTRMR